MPKDTIIVTIHELFFEVTVIMMTWNRRIDLKAIEMTMLTTNINLVHMWIRSKN